MTVMQSWHGGSHRFVVVDVWARKALIRRGWIFTSCNPIMVLELVIEGPSSCAILVPV